MLVMVCSIRLLFSVFRCMLLVVLIILVIGLGCSRCSGRCLSVVVIVGRLLLVFLLRILNMSVVFIVFRFVWWCRCLLKFWFLWGCDRLVSRCVLL